MSDTDMTINAKVVFDMSVTVIATPTLRDMENRINDLLSNNTKLVLENRELLLRLARRGGLT